MPLFRSGGRRWKLQPTAMPDFLHATTSAKWQQRRSHPWVNNSGYARVDTDPFWHSGQRFKKLWCLWHEARRRTTALAFEWYTVKTSFFHTPMTLGLPVATCVILWIFLLIFLFVWTSLKFKWHLRSFCVKHYLILNIILYAFYE